MSRGAGAGAQQKGISSLFQPQGLASGRQAAPPGCSTKEVRRANQGHSKSWRFRSGDTGWGHTGSHPACVTLASGWMSSRMSSVRSSTEQLWELVNVGTHRGEIAAKAQSWTAAWRGQRSPEVDTPTMKGQHRENTGMIAGAGRPKPSCGRGAETSPRSPAA